MGATNKQNYPERKAYFQNYHRNRHRQLRESVIKLLGSKCNCCGEIELLFLEIDHILNNAGEQRKEWGGRGPQFYNLYKGLLNAKIDQKDYQILCANCNHGKYRNNGICPHKKSP